MKVRSFSISTLFRFLREQLST